MYDRLVVASTTKYGKEPDEKQNDVEISETTLDRAK
jgi:hypothetical protein